MGWAGATWAVARLRPFGHVSFLTSLVGPRAGAREAHKDMAAPFTSGEEHLGRLVGHYREAQLGVGRNARRVARPARGSQDFHHFAESRFANARCSGVQIGDPLGVEPRRVRLRLSP